MPLDDANLSKQQQERAKQISFRIKEENSNTYLGDKNLRDVADNVDDNQENKMAKKCEEQSLLSGEDHSLTEVLSGENPPLTKEKSVDGLSSEEIENCEDISLDDAIIQGKELLAQIHLQIEKIYSEHFAGSAFGYSLNEVASDIEKYLQATLLVCASKGKELSEKEVDFIWAVLTRANVFEGTSSINQALEKAEILTKVNPHAVLLTVAVDKFYKKNETAILLTNIYDLYLLSCRLEKTKIIDKKQLLAVQFNFAQAQGVNIND